MLRRLPAWTLLVLWPIAAACGPDSTVVGVELCGDVQIPEDIDAVRVSILDAERNSVTAGTIELLQCPGSQQLELPQITELEAPIGEVWIVAQGLQEGVSVITSERRLRVEEDGRAPEVLLGLTRSCMRVTCALGQTCIDGTCDDAPWETDDGVCDGGPPSEGAGRGMASCAAP